LGGKLGDNIYLAKNRDRAYVPQFKLVRNVVDGIEIVYIFDVLTDWSEGMNSLGIGIVNSALMVKSDEKEDKIVKKTGQKAKDGEIIREALKCRTLDETLKVLTTFNGGVKGHTIVSDGVKMFTIESSTTVAPIIKEKDINRYVVRTNHGKDTRLGYVKGANKISSLLRKAQIEDNLEDFDMNGKIDHEDVFSIITNSRFDDNHPYNVVRNSKLKTASQMVMDLTNKKIIIKPTANGDFLGIDEYSEDGYEPLIEITVIE
jgi:hypothetical protein